jgi:hypothetical protein
MAQGETLRQGDLIYLSRIKTFLLQSIIKKPESAGFGLYKLYVL